MSGLRAVGQTIVVDLTTPPEIRSRRYFDGIPYPLRWMYRNLESPDDVLRLWYEPIEDEL